MWYFDVNYGSCSRFWYGGCDGNGNKFATTEECENTCVKPDGPGKIFTVILIISYAGYSRGKCFSKRIFQ
ncbi:unnamed protein product [Larinioides sclopetarius]|uniref:BPTI/Kunitz inhibitor domain-containing protein n=1 Tax=Larinioides sclopetarius TaxID=280406 RepID=A0AAV1Z6X7_9ARAC